MILFHIAPLIVGVLLVTQVVYAENTEHNACGYDACPKSDPKKLNVHLLPFTINHIGYTTFMDTAYNLNGKNQINSIIDSLDKNPARRFTYSDVSFIWKWWESESETNRQVLKKLIDEGRFEISNGGWISPDEAVTNYRSLIDDYTWSFRRLNDTLGSCARPKVGWQIGSHGHSREHASLFSQMGFDGTLINRVEPDEKYSRFAMKTAEFIWDASSSPSRTSDLFTSILSTTETRGNLCFDAQCDRSPIVDDPNDINYNIQSRVEQFVRVLNDTAKKYKTHNINYPIGRTNGFKVAELWYMNFDKIIKYINERNDSHINIFYSTPSCYLKSLNEQNLSWPIRNNDFFPYSSHYHQNYHNGYYTSKPVIKFLERQANNFLQVTKQLSVLSGEPDRLELQHYREIMAAMQNIHGITGDHLVHVGWDYVKKIHDNMDNVMHIVSKSLTKLMHKKETNNPPEFHSCLSLNDSVCSHSSENKKFVVTIYNPTSQPLTTFIRLPVQIGTYEVQDNTGKEMVTQIVPIPDPVIKIPGRMSNATMELVFRAENIPALGFKSFYVQQKSDELQSVSPSSDHFIGGDNYKITVNHHGRVHVNSLKDQNEFDFHQSFKYYENTKTDHAPFYKAVSGAIIFKPKHSHPKELSNKHGNFHVHKGPLVEEIHHVVNEWVSQVIRIYNDTDHIEFNWLIGPIPAEDRINKDIITRYSSHMKNHHIFYTDSNGRGMIRRQKKHNPHWWKLREHETVSANYYPVTSKITIEDKQKKIRMSVLVDRPEGGSSLHDGEIELMIHRRLSMVDNNGNGVPLNEVAHGPGVVVRGQHYLILNNVTDMDDTILKEKELSIQLHMRPWLFFTPVNQSFEEWRENFKMKSDGLIKSLPRNIRILTLEPWKDREILLRLEHLFVEKNTRLYSVPVEVDLKELFNGFTIQSIQEVSLGANQLLKDVHHLKWNPDIYHVSTNHTDKQQVTENSNAEQSTENPQTVSHTPSHENNYVVRLEPMEIRTFILKVAHGVKSTSTTSA